MRKELTEIVCCPDDKARLDLDVSKQDDHGDVVEGSLTCTECGFVFPIEDGIPNLLPKAYHVDGVKGAKRKPAAAGKKQASGGKPAGDRADGKQAADEEE